MQLSADGGLEWSTPVAVEEPGDRPDFAFVGISPDRTDPYTAHDGFLDPSSEWRTTPSTEGATGCLPKPAEVCFGTCPGKWYGLS